MKMVITFTCIYCDAPYDHEMDVDPASVTSRVGEGRMFIGVCPACMKKDVKINPEKAIQSFLNRHEAEIKGK